MATSSPLLLEHPHFSELPPVSTGREAFSAGYLDDVLARVPEISGPDLLATLTELTVLTVTRAIAPYGVTEVVVSGGGVRNPALMDGLRRSIEPAPLVTSDERGIPADGKEVVLWALLGLPHLARPCRARPPRPAHARPACSAASRPAWSRCACPSRPRGRLDDSASWLRTTRAGTREKESHDQSDPRRLRGPRRRRAGARRRPPRRRRRRGGRAAAGGGRPDRRARAGRPAGQRLRRRRPDGAPTSRTCVPWRPRCRRTG